MEPNRGTPLVSVIMATYHRPDLLVLAVRSVLAQVCEFPFEVVVCLSDPAAVEDRQAAETLAASDSRVTIAEGTDRGPGAARNAGMRRARGPILAFIDDDCEADAGWLRAGVAALSSADLVQGRTWPTEPTPGYSRTIWVDSLSGFWETCNLFVQRTYVDRAGMFDDAWALTDPTKRPWGEDIEWGWRLVRAGARPTFAPDARVAHIVEPRSFWGYLRSCTLLRHFPRVLRSTPELRQRFWARYFLNRIHGALTAVAGLGIAGVAAILCGHRRTGLLCVGASAATCAVRLSSTAAQGPRGLIKTCLTDWTEFGSLLAGSVRWRRLLL